MSFVSFGRAWKTALEPNLQRLWDRYFSLDSEEIEPKITKLYSELSMTIKPKYCLMKDVAQIAGTL